MLYSVLYFCHLFCHFVSHKCQSEKSGYVFDDVTGAAMSDVSSESETGNVSLENQVMGSATVGQREGQNETLTTEELRKRRQAYYER